MTDVSAFAELVPADHGLSVISTLRGDGSVQSSVVNAGVLKHPLRDIFRAAGGSHDDWDTYDRVMAQERRAAALIVPRRVYTNPQAS